MTETRIKWEPGPYGCILGLVGDVEEWLFQIWRPGVDTGGWQLDTTLPVKRRRTGATISGLKDEAEFWLSDFMRELGAEFKPPVIAVPGAGDSSEEAGQ
jgi:hypothetical protein